MAFIEPCFGTGHNLSLICQMTSEDIKHQLIIINGVGGGGGGGAGCIQKGRLYEMGGYTQRGGGGGSIQKGLLYEMGGYMKWAFI